MSRRPLSVLFVRPSDEGALRPLLACGPPRLAPGMLPVELLRLATAVKLGSRHRAFVHDARQHPARDRSCQAAATVLRARVGVVEVHPASIVPALASARALRSAGVDLVLATGPLAASHRDRLGALPEFDGVVHPGAPTALLTALGCVAAGSPADELAAACLLPPSPPPDDARGADRKLLDYARYRQAHPTDRPRGGARLDKGRWSATRILLRDETGALRSAEDVRAEREECILLGIPRQSLTGARPDRAWLDAVLQPAIGGTAIAPAPKELPTDAPLAADVLDLGDLLVADPDALAWGAAWLTQARAARKPVVGRAVFQGLDLEQEEQGLTILQGWGLSLDAVLAVEPDESWAAWFDAPWPGFVPDVPGGERTLELVERARVLLRAHPAPRVRALASRLVRWARA